MKILVTVPMDDKERAIIEAAAPKAEFTYAAANEVTADMMADKEIKPITKGFACNAQRSLN